MLAIILTNLLKQDLTFSSNTFLGSFNGNFASAKHLLLLLLIEMVLAIVVVVVEVVVVAVVVVIVLQSRAKNVGKIAQVKKKL